ncbi:serine hydrolase domain-containing protein [Streptomyces sp. NPDC059568]|uniref:serine hydrolase domain-containing protein n=1 Tax=Streptomyces sp. NPDC059568 TaxID=3346868 RepID=UPI0036A0E5D8
MLQTVEVDNDQWLAGVYVQFMPVTPDTPTGPLDAGHWQQRLDELRVKHGVPGAQLGILRLDAHGAEDEILTVASGVLSARAGWAATPDSVWQIGSITKVWTATVIMQLVDEGHFTLETPVKEIITDLTLGDPDVAEKLTVRHLLTHTSGIDGDIMTDTGRGDDALAKYVAALDTVQQNHPLGATWSYCNSGYIMLGRIIEVVTGRTWDAAIKEKLFTPLGLATATTLPEEAIVFAHSVGHFAGGENPVPASTWAIPRSSGPAGGINASTAEVLAFARMHMLGGVAADGTRVLSAESTAAMAALQTDCPEKILLGDSWGLGWMRALWDGRRVLGHDGNVVGQCAFLRIVPEAGVAVSLNTNIASAPDLYLDVFEEVLAEVAGVRMPARFNPSGDVEVDMTPYVGRYGRTSVAHEVLAADSGPKMTTEYSGAIAKMIAAKDQVDDLYPTATPGLFGVRPGGMESTYPVTFYSLPTGEQYLHFGARANPRKA